MDYQKTVPFANTEKAIRAVTGVFVQHGFQIVERSETAVELTGPGMISSRQNPLVGISRIRICRTSGALSIEAEFGSIRRLLKYIGLFILGMGVFFLILFGILFTKQGQPLSKIALIALAPFIPWPVIIPLMAVWLKSRTSRALDVLLSNVDYLWRQEEAFT